MKSKLTVQESQSSTNDDLNKEIFHALKSIIKIHTDNQFSHKETVIIENNDD